MLIGAFGHSLRSSIRGREGVNAQMKRNQRHFPDDFLFQLTREEKSEAVAICDSALHCRISSANIG
jgi:hypothetical protein